MRIIEQHSTDKPMNLSEVVRAQMDLNRCKKKPLWKQNNVIKYRCEKHEMWDDNHNECKVVSSAVRAGYAAALPPPQIEGENQGYGLAL